MSNRSITHIFLEANPRSALTINTGYNEMFVKLESSLTKGRNGLTYQFLGRGPTVVAALLDLDADIVALGITVETFAFPGHTQAALEAGREKAFAEMRRQIAAEQEAAALDAIRLTEEIDLVETLHLVEVERLAEVMVQ